MRMRKLGKGQSVVLCGPMEVQQKILEANEKVRMRISGYLMSSSGAFVILGTIPESLFLSGPVKEHATTDVTLYSQMSLKS